MQFWALVGRWLNHCSYCVFYKTKFVVRRVKYGTRKLQLFLLYARDLCWTRAHACISITMRSMSVRGVKCYFLFFVNGVFWRKRFHFFFFLRECAAKTTEVLPICTLTQNLYIHIIPKHHHNGPNELRICENK